MRPHDTELLRAAKAAEDASLDALAALRKAMEPGRVVTWQHGESRREGVVVEVLGFQWESARIRVMSEPSGKRVDVYAGRILRYLVEKR